MGTITKKRTIRQDENSIDKFEIEVTINFEGMTRAQLEEIAFRPLWIARQGVIRQNWKQEDVDGWVANGLTFMATDASKKPEEDPVEVIRRRIEAGTMTKEEAMRLLGL